MKESWTLTQETLDALLQWLNPDRESAGRKYEDLRRRLIKMFAGRGCVSPEDLTDETINRVSRKLKEITKDYSGDPAYYFLGVAKNVLREYYRRPPVPELPAPTAPEEDSGLAYDCLEKCLNLLTPGNRELILNYYVENKGKKAMHRQQLAARLKVAPNALRIRAYRLRVALQQCIKACIACGGEINGV